MDRTSEYILFKNSRVVFYTFGTGKRSLFCFHGFGENAATFAVLESWLGNDFTLYAIDLPYHGETRWQEGLLLAPADLLEIMDRILQKNHRTGTRFSLLGFSMGGRVALYLLQLVPARVERAVLLAPDGLHVNFWYWLGTQTSAGNKLFAYTMKKPRWFYMVANAGHAIGLVNKSIIKFIHHYLDDSQVRLMLYQRWTTMRRFKPNLHLLRQAINQHHIHVSFIFGRFDRIILRRRLRFLEGHQNVTVRTIDAGHHFLKQPFAEQIASLFNE